MSEAMRKPAWDDPDQVKILVLCILSVLMLAGVVLEIIFLTRGG